MEKNHRETTLIVACGVFRREIEKIVSERYPSSKIVFTNPLLDITPRKLDATLERLIDTHTSAEKILLVFGKCTPTIDSLVDGRKIFRLRGGSCYEILLGERFFCVMKEEKGSYFLTPYLCLHFNAIIKSLELTSPLLRERLFRNYRRIVLVDTGLYGGIEKSAQKVSKFLNLPLKVLKIDLEELEKRLHEAIRAALP